MFFFFFVFSQDDDAKRVPTVSDYFSLNVSPISPEHNPSKVRFCICLAFIKSRECMLNIYPHFTAVVAMIETLLAFWCQNAFLI